MRTSLFCPGLVVLLAAIVAPGQSDTTALRKEIEAQDKKLTSVFRKRDFGALKAMLTPDFTDRQPDGTVWDRKRYEAFWQKDFSGPDGHRKLTFKTEKVTGTGKRAVSIVHGRVTWIQTDDTGEHQGALDARWRHYWVRTAKGWKFQRGEALAGRKTTVDGKPVQ